MVDFLKSIFGTPAELQQAIETCDRRERLTQEEVMEHFDCQRFHLADDAAQVRGTSETV